jgi:hypothetical protein
MVQTFPDPVSGPAWGIRTYQTRTGLTCVQAGRTESGAIGAIGIDGAYGGDLQFHPFGTTRTPGLGDCAPKDARGHAFMNVEAVNTGASGGLQPCLLHDDALPREHCPASSLRDVYFGLLGPDATRITYVGDGGRTEVQQTRGPDGAYLVVTPLAQGSCKRPPAGVSSGPSSCTYDTQGEGLGPTLRSGEITAVTYRGGHVCRLPAPHGVTVRLAQCPVVGYVPVNGPQYTAAQIAAPVTARKLPSRYYCQRKGRYQPAALAIPCDHAIPPGYARVPFAYANHKRSYDPGRNLLVYISWTAHAPVESIEHSSYQIDIEYPKGCGAGGESTGTQTQIRTGEHVTRGFYVPKSCHGTYTAQVTYTPDLGPGVQEAPPGLRTVGTGHGTFLVGALTFTVP